MYKVVIVEDEESAALRMKLLLAGLNQEFEVLEVLDSIQSALEYFAHNAAPDLVFMDIHLADGLSFEILERGNLLAPIIFITAYDEYAVQAFKVNSIDYLLKPLKKVELQQAIDKFERFTGVHQKLEMKEVISAIENQKMVFQKRFIIKIGQSIKVIEVSDIAYFFTEERCSFLMTFSGQKILVDTPLEELQTLVNPSVFFRINRQFIVNIAAISKMFTHTKSRVKVLLNPAIDIETLVSAERSFDFKQWLMGK